MNRYTERFNFTLIVMALQTVNSNDIKLILSVQGYDLDFQYVVREIGFWSNGFSGSIPFNVKLNKNQLNVRNLDRVSFCENELNGIKLKRNFEHALAGSDIKPVLRTIFQLNSSNNSNYIGIVRDEPLDGLLHKCGLGSFVTYLDNVDVVKNTNSSLPTNEFFRQYMKKNPDAYIVCPIHERLTINEFPICAKAKAVFLADVLKTLSKNHVTINSTPDSNKPTLQSFLSEYDFTSLQ